MESELKREALESNCAVKALFLTSNAIGVEGAQQLLRC
jgi:hypothetical protein